jgi:hypothetical protein
MPKYRDMRMHKTKSWLEMPRESPNKQYKAWQKAQDRAWLESHGGKVPYRVCMSKALRSRKLKSVKDKSKRMKMANSICKMR